MELLISTAFNSGLWDSLNPCSLTNLIVYVFMLFYFCRTPAAVRIFAVSFIISSLIVNYHVLHGIFFYLYSINWLFNILQYTYLALSVVIIILGCIYLADWKNHISANNPDKIIIKQHYVIPTTGRKPINTFLVLLLGFLAGAVLAFMLGVWPLGWNVYNFWAESAAVGDVVSAILVMALYALFLMIPVVLVTALFLSAMKSKKNQDFLARYISLIKIMTAGFFIAVGLDLSYIVLR